jgi:hypothetical protein
VRCESAVRKVTQTNTIRTKRTDPARAAKKALAMLRAIFALTAEQCDLCRSARCFVRTDDPTDCRAVRFAALRTVLCALMTPVFALRKSHCAPRFALAPAQCEGPLRTDPAQCDRRRPSSGCSANRPGRTGPKRVGVRTAPEQSVRNFLAQCERVRMVCYVRLVCGTFLIQGQGQQLNRPRAPRVRPR